jgi:hypothetical protein
MRKIDTHTELRRWHAARDLEKPLVLGVTPESCVLRKTRAAGLEEEGVRREAGSQAAF